MLLTISYVFCCLIRLSSSQTTRTLNVGLMVVANNSAYVDFVGYQVTGAAVLIARDRIMKEQVLPGYNINLTYRIDDCQEDLAAGISFELMNQLQFDAIIGPTCTNAAVIAASIGKLYNFPVVMWGLTTSAELNDLDRYPTIALVSVSSLSLGYAIGRIMKEYKWTEFGYIYSLYGDPDKCADIKNDLQTAINSIDNITLTAIEEIVDVSTKGMQSSLSRANNFARVFVLCFPEGFGLKRRFILAAQDGGYNSDEYQYIIADTKARGFVQTARGGKESYIWEATAPDGRDDEAHKAFSSVLVVSDLPMTTASGGNNLTQFNLDVISRMKEPPFYCTTECQGEQFSKAGVYAPQLHDAMMLWAYALNRTLKQDPTARKDGRLFVLNAPMSFIGASGLIEISGNGTRIPTFYLRGLNASRLPAEYASVTVDDNSTVFNKSYTDETIIWQWKTNHARPKTVPECGYQNNEVTRKRDKAGTPCPVSFVEAYLLWVIIAAVIVGVAMLTAAAGIFYTIRQKKLELERQNKLWQIPFVTLRSTQEMKKMKGEQSYRSLSSGVSSTGTRITQDTRVETRNFKFFVLDNEKVAAMKHTGRYRGESKENEEMRKLRTVEHDNLNRFIGLSLDAPQLFSIWRHCGRGSLKDVVQRGSITMDYFFVYSLIRDIVNGLNFLHKSHIIYHGHLTSSACLVDDRFQVKISNFGIQRVREADPLVTEDLLWSAPEVLRGEILGSQKGDIYSFAIICSELITKRSAWDMENRKETADTIIYWLKRNKGTPVRPELTVHESIEVNPGLIELIRDCWSQEPERRPTIEQIRSLIKGMITGKNDNLMDHVFNIMESYAATLEDEVAERTKELTEEKKKSDLLLYRMLPRQVADKLKLGQSVQPETFDSVTVFFSDVVSFTTLASRSTPIQVVNLLNDLYSIFDGIIEKHDVYKVETIGDGYLCVSGLPHRNGNEHAKEIASMSLGFMESLTTFKIPHLPNERISIRVGMHCGSVVAGVVGLTMPRYCLFGDTVNTASRMESNGKANQIHLSPDANNFLVNVVGGFETEPRGEVIIKGKGVMETYWLKGRIGGYYSEPAKVETKLEKIKVKHSLPRSPESDTSEARSITPVTGIYETYKKNEGQK